MGVVWSRDREVAVIYISIIKIIVKKKISSAHMECTLTRCTPRSANSVRPLELYSHAPSNNITINHFIL